MMSASEIRRLTGLSKDARQAVAAALHALAQWRKEILSANERYLEKAVDQMAAAQRAIGWPPQVTAGAREQLLQASKVQTQMIERIVDTWERQLKSPRNPTGVPAAFKVRTPGPSGRTLPDPVSGMVRLGEMALVPYRLWIQAATAWQRNWADAMSARAERPGRAERPARPRPVKRARPSARRPRSPLTRR
jgi:hypothetical protein